MVPPAIFLNKPREKPHRKLSIEISDSWKLSDALSLLFVENDEGGRGFINLQIILYFGSNFIWMHPGKNVLASGKGFDNQCCEHTEQ